MVKSIKVIEEEIEKIKQRNKRVELDKAWEMSWTRKIVIAILTYIVIVIFFYFAKLPNPLVNSIVPALAFILSTLSLSIFKKIWLNFRK
jgi:polyferredoxin